MKLITYILLIFLTSCLNKKEERTIDSNIRNPKPVISNQIVTDTIKTTSPISIGNNKGTITIIGSRTFKDKQLTKSNFVISLNDIPNISLTKRINKDTLINTNKTVYLKDTISDDLLASTVIKTITYTGIRSNTLFFSVVLEAPLKKKEIIGRFSLFYQTKKKGTIYGCFIDEVKEISQNKTH